MHILRRAAIFLLPLFCLAGILYVADKWTSHQKLLKERPKKNNIVAETPKNDVEYKLVTTEEKKIKIKTKSDSFFTVALDPTHGGDDVGNIGYKSAVESNLNLQFAFKLARSLRMRGVKVYLTRMEDANVPVEVRFRELEKKNPNLLLSINCSYSDVRSLKGIEVYGPTSSTQSAMAVESRVSQAIKQDLDLASKTTLERRAFEGLALPTHIPMLGLFIGYISNEEDVVQLEDSKYVDSLAERVSVSIERGLQKRLW